MKKYNIDMWNGYECINWEWVYGFVICRDFIIVFDRISKIIFYSYFF